MADWLDQAKASGLAAFSNGLSADLDAVAAALREPWFNGQTEGQINRLKMLKRQVYGAAGYRPPSCTSSAFGMKASQKLSRTQDCLPIDTLPPRIVSLRHHGGRMILNVDIK